MESNELETMLKPSVLISSTGFKKMFKRATFFIIASIILSTVSNPAFAEIEGDCTGSWVDIVSDPPNTIGHNCVVGKVKHIFSNMLRGTDDTCQNRLDYAISKGQYQSSASLCGVDVNPCGAVLEFFPNGQNCCVYIKQQIWKCTNEPIKENNFGLQCINLKT